MASARLRDRVAGAIAPGMSARERQSDPRPSAAARTAVIPGSHGNSDRRATSRIWKSCKWMLAACARPHAAASDRCQRRISQAAVVGAAIMFPAAFKDGRLHRTVANEVRSDSCRACADIVRIAVEIESHFISNGAFGSCLRWCLLRERHGYCHPPTCRCARRDAAGNEGSVD